MALFRLLIVTIAMQMFAPAANAFVLFDANYRLANPKDTAVNIATGGCRTNGVSDDQLKGAIQSAIDRYWNTIAEANLMLRVGDEVSRTLSAGNASAGEILIGCSPLGAGGPSGATYPNAANGSSVIVLNGTTFVPGGYTAAALLGVIGHEMGHALGLAHSDDNASIMTYRTNSWSPAPTYLAQDDKDGIAYLYPYEGNLQGLLGGCSAAAKTLGTNPSALPWDSMALELIFFAIVFLSVGIFRRRVR